MTHGLLPAGNKYHPLHTIRRYCNRSTTHLALHNRQHIRHSHRSHTVLPLHVPSTGE